MKKRLGTFKLNRDTQQRSALFRSLLQSLVLRESITTTSAKANAVRPIFERLLTTARTATVPARRRVQTLLQSASLTKILVDDIAPRYKESRGGYTSLIPVGVRKGDNASLVKLSLTLRKKSKQAAESKTEVKEVVEATKKVAPAPSLVQPEKLAPTKAAPKLVRRTGKRGDK